MLNYFSVKGFRNFETLLEFNFKNTINYDFNKECIKNDTVNTSIIYGKNGSGKSNLGMAITDIKTLLLNSDIAKVTRTLFLNGNTVDAIATFNYIFEFNGRIVNLTYSKNKKADLVSEELTIDNTIIYKYDHTKNKLLEENLMTITADTLNFSSLGDNLSNSTPISILSYISNNANIKSETMYELLNYIRSMHFMNAIAPTNDKVYDYILEHELVDDFNAFLKNFDINDNIVSNLTSSGEKILAIQYLNKTISFKNSASSGTKAVALFYYWYKNADKISFLYLDEFDAFYHYELSKNLIDLLKNIDALQVVFTTHNTNLLSNKILRPDCYFVLGNNTLTSLPNATKRELSEGHNLEKLYIGGDFNV